MYIVASSRRNYPWKKTFKRSLVWRRVPVLYISESYIEIKINLNFYFYTYLWCLNRFYEGLKGLHKTFCGRTKKCKNKNLSIFFCSSGNHRIILMKNFYPFSGMEQNILVLTQTSKFQSLQLNFWKVMNTLMTHCFYKTKNNFKRSLLCL